ncbi:MAG: HAMP domain-containing sensor histidine kinase [Actinobacteria bacterium]|nr:HAMP domain-containing sensor histidine kinase [Actinomycetota bacterium]
MLIILSYSTFSASRASSNQRQILTNAEAPAASIIFTQRETLVYTTKLAEWTNGNLTRREVQIARALLAQRLAVIDSTGSSVGSRAVPKFFDDLRLADAIVQNAPADFLPSSLHAQIGLKIHPIIDDIMENARDLIVSYQQSVDQQTNALIVNHEKIARNNLLLLYLFISLMALLVAWVSVTFARQYRSVRSQIQEEATGLISARADLLATQALVSRLETLDEEKNEFISNVNHELRTPLTSIIGYIDLIAGLSDENTNPKVNAFLRTVDRNAVLLQDLVESMLLISRLDSDESKDFSDSVDIRGVLADTVFVLQPALNSSGIKVEIIDSDTSKELAINGDRGQVSQIFINLLANAIKFSPDNSSILVDLRRVRVENQGEVIRISITDRGIGIPSEDIGKLFTRFFRAQNAVDDQFEGTGLGLAIVHKIVTLHGGEIFVDSEVGRGTTMTMQFPVTRSRVEQLVKDRRWDVMNRAISKMSEAPVSNLGALAHEMGGAIAFYSYEREGARLVEFSHWLRENPHLDDSDILAVRDNVVAELKKALEETNERMDA